MLLPHKTNEKETTMPAEDDPKLMRDDDSFISDDSQSSTDDHRSTSTGSQPKTEIMEEVVIGRSETKAVKRLRILTFCVLVIVAVLASVGVYLYTSRDELASFSAEFESNGLKVISSFQADAYRKLQTLHSLSSTITAYANDNNATWPFVTVPDVSHVFGSYLSLADAAAILMIPIVQPAQRAAWEAYSVENQGWIQEGLEAQTDFSNSRKLDEQNGFLLNQTTGTAVYERLDEISPFIKNYVGIDTSPGPWMVWWQYAPVIENRWFVNFNRLVWDGFEVEADIVMSKEAVLSKATTFEPGLDFQSTRDFDFTTDLLEAGGQDKYEPGEPLGYIYYPILDHLEGESRNVVAILSATVYWKSYFEGILPESVSGVIAVVENSEGQQFTFRIDGKDASFVGQGDLHDPGFDSMELSAKYSSFTEENNEGLGQYQGFPVDDEHLSYRIRVYPSVTLQASYVTTNPVFYTVAMVVVFLLTAAIFITYDCFVERRQKLVLTKAVKSEAVVASMFPKQIRDRLMEEASKGNKGDEASVDEFFASKGDSKAAAFSSKPIADFFPETTIMFADIRGFTAWCSTREPAQVFLLLESVYHSFDEIAKRRRIFKVETVGDCYVAVCGLPEPRKDHAVAMARFARDCLNKFNQMVSKLEVSLGPDTGDLKVRIGLHSGAVTGGVIRGENARFQLFGDTVNVAARMESTGVPSRIQISKDTAELLVAADKSHWCKPRDDTVNVKGKGEMTTYFLVSGEDENKSTTGSSSDGEAEGAPELSNQGNMTDKEAVEVLKLASQKTMRLVSWNVDLLKGILKQIVARRQASKTFVASSIDGQIRILDKVEENVPDIMTKPIQEVQECIHLPEFDAKIERDAARAVELDASVTEQLYDYVSNIAALYRDVPFHNFEHASHVTMSVSKLLARIIAPTGISKEKSLHDHTYGITSDPLTQFACLWSALIHDVDHCGVPNAQLVKEASPVAEFYEGKSVAEQNSVDLAWNLLMDDSYKALRATIYQTRGEMERFRQLVVNSVMATDIVDKDLKTLRNARWERAFSENANDNPFDDNDSTNRKATIVIEHLIQASDVAHTMQHWHIYRKWNERFFFECYKAYKEGRSASDPSENWYKGEIGFFDFYIIPLAKKLKECGVFGVSSDEYLNYAVRNRHEWESRGQEVVSEMLEKYQTQYGETTLVDL